MSLVNLNGSPFSSAHAPLPQAMRGVLKLLERGGASGKDQTESLYQSHQGLWVDILSGY